MTGLGRLLDPESIAIAGLSADPSKHGRRVLGHLRRLGFRGRIWGVHPGLPQVDDVPMWPSLGELPSPPDLVVCAVPAAAAVEIAQGAEGVGGLVVFAGGFAEAGESGRDLQERLAEAAGSVGARVLGPNSGGLIRSGRGLAASFLTCLDRPPEQVRSGPVGLVTQSGGTGSYIHNLAAAAGSGLALSVSTGNEADLKLGEVLGEVSRLDEVEAILAIVETVRDGRAFIAAVEESLQREKPVVVCRMGKGDRGRRMMTSHTGAMAVPDELLDGIIDSLGVVVAETPGEGYEVAETMARAERPGGSRVGVVTHSGGVSIHLADLAERHRVELPSPQVRLQERLAPLIDHGTADNPLDMGGIIGGPSRFAEVVARFAESGEYDVVLAVSTPHPPEHTPERVEALLGAGAAIPVIHLWMAGDQAGDGRAALRRAGVPVSEEPRAAIKALSGLTRTALGRSRDRPEPIGGPLDSWGLPLLAGHTVGSAEEAVAAAGDLGYPAVLKIQSPDLAHKSDVGGVLLDLAGPDQVRSGFGRLADAAQRAGIVMAGVRVEPYRPGLEIIVGAVQDPVFGPVVSVGIGGVATEVWGDVVFAPAPVSAVEATDMVDRLKARRLLDGFRGSTAADTATLAEIVSVVSRGLVGSGLAEVELNPVIWTGEVWVAVDWLTVVGEGAA